jgi:PAS domain S-box-containing protein
LLKPLEPEIVKAKVAVFVDLFRAQQQIKQQAAWYSTTLKSIGDAVIATDSQGNIRFMNPVAESLTGWTLAEAHGMPVESVFHVRNQETRAETESPAARIVREGTLEGLANHTVLVAKNGKEFLLEDSGTPIRDEKGGLLGVVIVFRDATAKRRAAARRNFISMASQVLLSSLDVSATLNAVCKLALSSTVDCCLADVALDGNIIERVAVAHRDSQKEELIRRISPLAAAPLDSSSDSLVHRALREGTTVLINELSDTQLQLLAIAPEGFQAFMGLGFKSCICVPLSLRGTELGALTVLSEAGTAFSPEDGQMLEELAVRVSTSIENARLYDKAQKSIRLRDEFLSIAAHELRTPITPLTLQLHTIKNLVSRKMLDSYPAEKLDRIFNIADRQMERFQKLIEELLDACRIRAGRLGLEKQTVDLADVVRGVVRQFEDALKNANCQIEVEAVPAIGDWDKFRVEQIFINLLSNAMKYGAGQPIKVTVEAAGDRAQLKVQDHGQGIEKADQARIFDRFERAASVGHFPGLGLGLYITKQVVEAHGGTIGVESEAAKGATFIVVLPLRGATEQRAA